jgi:hypothetical protein
MSWPEMRSTPLRVADTIYADPTDDLATLKTGFSLESYMATYVATGTPAGRREDHIPISRHVDEWLDSSLIMTRVLLMGYPPIPRSDGPYLVADGGVVQSIIRTYGASHHPYLIVSTTARGGFSGGPVISQDGRLLGVMTDSFTKNDLPEELGHSGVISVQPLWQLLGASGAFPASNAEFAGEFVPMADPQEYERPERE